MRTFSTSQALSFSRSFSIQSSNFVESLSGSIFHGVDDVLVGDPHEPLALERSLATHFLADHQAGQWLALSILEGEQIADVFGADFQLVLIRGDHAEQLVIPLILAGDAQDLAGRPASGPHPACGPWHPPGSRRATGWSRHRLPPYRGRP